MQGKLSHRHNLQVDWIEDGPVVDLDFVEALKSNDDHVLSILDVRFSQLVIHCAVVLVLGVIHSERGLSFCQRVILHRLKEAAKDTINQVALLMVFHVRVLAKRAHEFVLHKLPPKHFEADHEFLLLLGLLLRAVVALDCIVAVGLHTRVWLFLLILSLQHFLAKHVPHSYDVVPVVKERQIRLQVLQHICLVVVYLDVLLHEAEERRLAAASHVFAPEGVAVESLQLCQVACAAQTGRQVVQAGVRRVHMVRVFADVLQRVVDYF